MPKTALILAAGLGTRLNEYTKNRPKALVEINGKPLLEHLILKLKAQGFEKIVVNVHHFADMIIDFIETNHNFGIKIFISDESDELLDTGGAIWKAQAFLKDEQCFLVHNVDVLSDIDLNNFREKHLVSGALATMAVRDRITDRKFLFDADMRLQGWQNGKTQERILVREDCKNLNPLAFSGIHYINSEIFSLHDYKGAFSIVHKYLDLSKDHLIKGFEHNTDTWLDVGKPEQLKIAQDILKP